MFHRPLILATVFAAALSSGCDPFKSTEDLYKAGQAAYDAGNYSEAVLHLKSAVQKDPNLATARYLLGVTHNELGKFVDAEKELKRALALGYDIADANTALAVALLGQGEYNRVLTEVTIPAHAKPEAQAKLVALKGMAKLGKNDREGAGDAFAEALKLVPNEPDALVGQGWLAAQAGKTDEALKLTEAALAAAPRHKEAGLLKAALLRGSGKTDEAVAAYQAVLAIDPREVRAHNGLVSLYLGQKNFAAARKQVDQSRKQLPDNLVIRFLDGQVSLRELKFTAARDAAQDVLKTAPKFLPAEYLLGLANLALGSHQQAAQSLRVVVREAPGTLHARAMLASAELSLGEPQLALAAIKPALDAGSTYPTLLSMAGHVYLALGQPAQSAQYFEAALKARETAGPAAALALARQGGASEQGLADMQAVPVPEPGATPSDFALIAAYVRQGKFDEALAAIERLEKKEPGRPEPAYLRATLHVGRSEFDLARKSYEKAASIDPGYVPAAVALANLDLRDGDRASAKKRYETVLAKKKDNLTALLSLASIASQERNEAEMIKLLVRAEKAHPQALEPVQIQIQTHLAKREFDQAIAVAQRFQKANPDSNPALEFLAQAYQAAGNKDKALTAFKQLAQRAPNSPQVQLQLARAQQAAGNANQARDAINSALSLQPGYLEAERALFLLDAETRGYEEAKKSAQRIQQNHPKSPMGFMLQGDAEMVLKRFDQAIKSYEAAAALGPSTQLTLRLHQAYMSAGQRAQADAKISAWLRQFPNDLDTRFYLAQVYMSMGQDKQAMEQYEFLVKAQPQNAIAWNNLAWLYLKAKDSRSVSAAAQAYKIRPDEAGIIDTYGWMLVQQGDLARGVPLLEKAHTRAKNSPEIQYHYAAALVKAGNKTKAKPLLEQLVKGQPFPQREDAKRLLAQL